MLLWNNVTSDQIPSFHTCVDLCVSQLMIASRLLFDSICLLEQNCLLQSKLVSLLRSIYRSKRITDILSLSRVVCSLSVLRCAPSHSLFLSHPFFYIPSKCMEDDDEMHSSLFEVSSRHEENIVIIRFLCMLMPHFVSTSIEIHFSSI